MGPKKVGWFGVGLGVFCFFFLGGGKVGLGVFVEK